MKTLWIPLLLSPYIVMASGFQPTPSKTLWYESPASIWEETLPLGNGRLGMMPDGGIKNEKIVLCEISMWSGSEFDYSNPEASKSLPEIRQLLLEGKNREAQKVMYEHFVPKKVDGHAYGAFQMLGDLDISYDYPSGEKNPSEYTRGLDISKGIAWTEFTFPDGLTYFREYSAPRGEDGLLVHLSSSETGKLNFSYTLSRPERGEVTSPEFGVLKLSGELYSGQEGVSGVKYVAESSVKVFGTDARVEMVGDSMIKIIDADSAWLGITAATSYIFGEDYSKDARDMLVKLMRDPKEAFEKGQEAHSALMDRAEVFLTSNANSLLPTDKRILAFQEDETDADALGSDSNWYWAADFAGNSWMCDAQNYGYMELNLIDGANCIIYDADMNVVSRGTFLLDTDNHTIGFSDVYPLWTTNSNPASNGSKSFNLLYLSDDAMIMFAPGYNTGINYVTKDYFDNYQEAEVEEEPSLPDGWEDLVSQVVVSTTTIKWTLSTENPTDWCSLGGARLNGWNSLQDYTDCGWYGTPNPDAYANFSMTLNSVDKTATFEYPDGTKVETTYTLNEKGIYTFGDPIPSGLSGALGDWDSFYVDSNNSLRIMSIEKKAGNLSGMWLGAKSDDKDEYHAYHFIPNLGNEAGGGSGGGAALNTKYYSFNADNVNFYNDGGYARISLNNPWGDPANDALDCAPISWTNNFTITFKLSGTPAGFSGKAGLSLNKNDWSIVLWAPDNLSTNVSGDGVYTVTYDAEPFNVGDLMMCAVEISNLDADTEGLTAEVLSIASDVNGKQWSWNPDNVNFYNDGDYARISMNNPWGDPANDAIDCNPINWANTFAVTFKLTGTPAGFSGKAGLSLNKNDWSIVLWAPDNLNTNVNGDGTYTVVYDAEPFNAGDLMMFAVEISNLDATTDGLKAEVVDIRTW